ncbi:MAG: glycosyltransferase family 9 protein [Pseudomonadota bacterium]
MNNILVINLARLGDIVQSIPMLENLKQRYPDTSLSLLLNRNFEQVCPLVPHVDEFITLDFMKIRNCMISESSNIEETYAYLKYFYRDLKDKQYKKIINITPHYIGIYSALLAGESSMPEAVPSAWANYYLNITRHWKTLPFHVADLFTKIAGLCPRKVRPQLSVDEAARNAANAFLRTRGLADNDILIGLNPGASTPEKQWPVEYFEALAKEILSRSSARIILYGTKAEAAHGEYLESRLSGKMVINAIGKTTVAELAALMVRTKILVTNDTGSMHVAAACGTRIISLHMGKEKCISTGPYGEGHIALQPRLACHPCEKPEQCRTFECRKLISPQLVFYVVDGLLKNTEAYDKTPVEFQLKKAEVFVSKYDMEGFVNFYPFWKCELSLSTLCTEFLRLMWNLLLSDETARDEPEAATGVLMDTLIVNIKRYYYITEINGVYAAWLGIDRYLAALISYAQEGINFAEAIEKAGMNPLGNLKDLKSLTQKIEALDYRIISYGETVHDFATLTHMFCFEKEKLDGKEISEMARNTEIIYRKLQTRARVLKIMGNQFFEKINY